MVARHRSRRRCSPAEHAARDDQLPHNPTGAILSADRYEALIELCRKHGIYILHDEIFNGLGTTGAKHLPFIADIYERGLSLNVTSKAYGLPGLRVGWIACQDADVLSRMERFKHYLSICNSGPSEQLAVIALENRDAILARNCAIIDENLPKWDTFFGRYPGHFEWQRPDGSCMGFPRYLGSDGVDAFATALVEEAVCSCCRRRSTALIVVRVSTTDSGSATADTVSTTGSAR